MSQELENETGQEPPIKPEIQSIDEAPKVSLVVQGIQLLVVLFAFGLIAYYAISFLIQFIWWIVGFLALPVLIINRKWVGQILVKIKGLFAKNKWLGLLASLGGIAGLAPFVGFLFLKTIWDFRKSDLLSLGSKRQAKKLPPSE